MIKKCDSEYLTHMGEFQPIDSSIRLGVGLPHLEVD